MPNLFLSLGVWNPRYEYSFYVKSIATYAPPKVDINNSFLGSVVSGRVLLFVILIFYYLDDGNTVVCKIV